MSNTLIEIQQFAMEQMEKWGLIEKNWTFVWDNRAISRYGQCRYRKKEIGVTKKLALINTIEESKDVISALKGNVTKTKLRQLTKKQLREVSKAEFGVEYPANITKTNLVNKVYSNFHKK